MRGTIKVAQLISSGGFYGAENMLANLLEGLRDLNANVALYVLDNAHNSHLEIAARASNSDIPVTIIPCKGRADALAAKALRASLLNSGVSVLHTHGYKADSYGYWAARSTGIALISTCHNWTKASVALRLYCILDKLVLRRFDRVVAVSSQVERELLNSGLHRERLCQIANGVASPPFAVSVQPSIVHAFLTIGMATRLVEEKGIKDFLLAAAQLRSAPLQLRFVIAGDGPLRARFEGMASALGVADCVEFMGFVPDMRAFYSSLDVFVLPSLREGLPMCILEAQAAGRPVIASRVGAIPDVVIDDWSGLLIEARDETGLVSALRRLIEDQSLRIRLGVNAQSLINESYSALAMSKHYLSVYREACRQPLHEGGSAFSANALEEFHR